MCLLEVLLVRPLALGERGKAEAGGDGGVPASLAVVSASERNGARARRPAGRSPFRGHRSDTVALIAGSLGLPKSIERTEKGPTPRSLSSFYHVSEIWSRTFSWFGQVCRHSESHESNHTFSAGRTRQVLHRERLETRTAADRARGPRPGLDSANRLTRVSILRPIKVPRLFNRTSHINIHPFYLFCCILILASQPQPP